MEQAYFKEIFEYPNKEFQEHLENPFNERIIFSGKYGIGKTKFLSDFFTIENQNSILKSEKYDVYRLFPTNYSIASNEDILRYIKYDIIIEMLKKSVTLDEIKLNLLDTFPTYVKENLHKVTAGLVYMIPKVGKEIVECFDRIDKLKEEYLKFHETNKSSGDKLIEYLEKLEIKDGSIYESDITTKIISETILKNNNKESVLLIDDIDRLDPEHVFRILNVFASHFDANTISGNKNKFNFSKIIIVCDFNNIRNLFHHRYGTEADFMGYIDKFYSSDVYHFDNKQAIIGVVDKVFDSLNMKSRGDDVNLLRQGYFHNKFLSTLISILVARGFISLRNIIKLYKKDIGYHYEKIYFDKRNSEIAVWSIKIVMQLKILRDFFGDYQNMKKTIGQPLLANESIEGYEWRFGEMLYILSNNIHNFYPRNVFLYTFHDTPIVLDVKLGFTNDNFENANLFSWTKEMEGTIPVKGEYINITESMFWTGLNDTIEFLHKLGYLK